MAYNNNGPAGGADGRNSPPFRVTKSRLNPSPELLWSTEVSHKPIASPTLWRGFRYIPLLERIPIPGFSTAESHHHLRIARFDDVSGALVMDKRIEWDTPSPLFEYTTTTPSDRSAVAAIAPNTVQEFVGNANNAGGSVQTVQLVQTITTSTFYTTGPLNSRNGNDEDFEWPPWYNWTPLTIGSVSGGGRWRLGQPFYPCEGPVKHAGVLRQMMYHRDEDRDRKLAIPSWSHSPILLAVDLDTLELAWQRKGWEDYPNTYTLYTSIGIDGNELRCHFERITYETFTRDLITRREVRGWARYGGDDAPFIPPAQPYASGTVFPSWQSAFFDAGDVGDGVAQEAALDSLAAELATWAQSRTFNLPVRWDHGFAKFDARTGELLGEVLVEVQNQDHKDWVSTAHPQAFTVYLPTGYEVVKQTTATYDAGDPTPPPYEPTLTLSGLQQSILGSSFEVWVDSEGEPPTVKGIRYTLVATYEAIGLEMGCFLPYKSWNCALKDDKAFFTPSWNEQ